MATIPLVLWIAAGVVLIVVVARLLYSGYRPARDIKSPKLEDLDWNDRDQSLKKVYDYLLNHTAGTANWYQVQRQPKRRWGAFLRFGALLATAIAGAIPLSELLVGVQINAAWSTVLLAIAGLFVSADLLGGYTSGWVRYMLAQQKVERCRDAFLFDWNALLVGNTDTVQMLERAKSFLLAVGKIVDEETQEWATEFRSALRELEKARQAAEETQRTGAIEVTMRNPQLVAEWSLEVDGAKRGKTSGKTIVVTDVPVGIRRIFATGVALAPPGKTLSAEGVVKVDGGAASAKELELA